MFSRRGDGAGSTGYDGMPDPLDEGGVVVRAVSRSFLLDSHRSIGSSWRGVTVKTKGELV